MATKKTATPTPNAQALTHNPFAQLASDARLSATLAAPKAQAPATPTRPSKPPLCRVRLHLETKGHSGKVVTRITGLPVDTIEVIASRLRKALGCGAVVQDSDLLLQGSLCERAKEWLDRAGDLRAIAAQPPQANHRAPDGPTVEPEPPARSQASGTVRGNVRPGQRVAVVLKADQPSGALTEGIVAELLTNSAEHPRGIKVRLESGEVGRVKVIFS
jgi:uncharacterized repeat protein (TIGR03833 family)